MVGTDAHSDICILFLTILHTTDLLLSLDDWLEDVSIIVRVLTLQHAHQTLEAHTRINDIHGQLLQRTVSLAVELHEHKVPYLNHLWIVHIDQFTTGFLGFLLRSTAIDMNL